MPPIPHPRLGRLAAVCLVTIALSAQAQTIYTWKDAKGVTHYADAPPKGAGKQPVKTVKTAPAPSVAPTPSPTAVAASTASAEATDIAARKASEAASANARCSQARANLTALQGSTPVGPDADGDGKPDSTLGSDERAKQVAAMQAAIQQNCAGT